MIRSIKQIIVLLALVVLIAVPVTAGEFSFSDITFWVGSGSNRAAVAFDWNDGITPRTLAWGYCWDSSVTPNPTGKTMLDAIRAADPRLNLRYRTEGGGPILYGAGYDMDMDGFTYVPGANDTGHAGDAEDRYKEGWDYAGYWSYNTANNQDNVFPTVWGYDLLGFSGRALKNNSWDCWVWSPGYYANDVATPIAATVNTPVVGTPAVPEPSSLSLALFSLIGLAGSAKLLRHRK
ncbi:MAG: PEP-CTERM sorting domain-containing protein [Armatimonadota bacterium]|nr:PEP-CTERM sorting domain-containing protein [bacterium]